jgi:acetyl-CoA acetyltransferase
MTSAAARRNTDFRGSVAIVGIGATEFSKRAGRTELQLAAEAIRLALADAALPPTAVDGLVSYTIDPVEETELVRSVGFQQIHYSSRIPYGGGGSMGTLQHASAAITSGAADVAVIYRACRARSGNRFGGAKVATGSNTAHTGTTASQWATPFGVLTPASWMSLNAVRYMHEYGVTSEDFGRAVVQFRAYAATNPAAWGYERPLTLEAHQASRWIAEPAMRMFDCCQETDGAVALVLTSAARARDLPQPPVLIEGAATAALFEQEIATDHYLPDLAVMAGSAALADRLFDLAGCTLADIDAAMIYDAFSPLFLMQLEGLGFCKPGEAKDFIADGNIGPAGRLPCNTNGGLIGEGYIHGLNLVTEAVRQLRGTAANQLSRVDRVLVTASRTGAVLSAA